MGAFTISQSREIIAICTLLHSIGKHTEHNHRFIIFELLFRSMQCTYTRVTWATGTALPHLTMRCWDELDTNVLLSIDNSPYPITTIWNYVRFASWWFLVLAPSLFRHHWDLGMVWSEWLESPDCSRVSPLHSPGPGQVQANSEQVEMVMMIVSQRKSCAHSILLPTRDLDTSAHNCAL